ncbi:MAG TPA: ABC transporter ATP-binding protein [Nitrososphaeraceae archaeon]|nr:ABC transporter ATP-binding protein [Nitrososphaeraceae archaeon]
MKLQVRNLSKKFKSTSSDKAEYIIAIENIDLTIGDGEFVSIVGPSGCGKTTLLNILAGLDKPTEGEIILNGHEIDGTGPDRIMVFQENALFPWLKVIENVEFGLKIAGLQKDKRRQIALAHLETMQLTKFADSYVYQLSGGMKQRVALARALVLDPEILLMDEPFASLDSQTRDLLSVELQLIWSRTRKNIIFVTHNIMESVCLGDKVFVFTSRPGKIKREITINHRRPRLTEDDELKPFYREVLGELRSEISAARKQKTD